MLNIKHQTTEKAAVDKTISATDRVRNITFDTYNSTY